VKRTLTLAAAAAITLSLAACSGTEAPAEKPATTEAAETATASPTPTAEPDPVAENWDDIVAFVEAVYVGETDTAMPLTAKGSPAAECVAYIRDNSLAEQTAGFDPHEFDDGYSFDDDERKQEVAISFRDTTGNGSDPQDYTWSDWKVTDDGKIKSWTGASGPINKVLGKKHDKQKAKGQTVKVAHAYQSNSGTVVIVLKVDSNVSGYPDYAPVYVGPDGVARKPTQANATDLVEGATSYLSYAYTDADFGGKLKYLVDYETPVTLTIKRTGGWRLDPQCGAKRQPSRSPASAGHPNARSTDEDVEVAGRPRGRAGPADGGVHRGDDPRGPGRDGVDEHRAVAESDAHAGVRVRREWASLVAKERNAYTDVQKPWEEAICSPTTAARGAVDCQAIMLTMGLVGDTASITFWEATDPDSEAYMGDPPLEVAELVTNTAIAADEVSSMGSHVDTDCFAGDCVSEAFDLHRAWSDLGDMYAAWGSYL